MNYYEKMSFFSKVTLIWPYPLLKLGNTRPLESTDIDKIRENESCVYQQKCLDKYILDIYLSSSKYGLMNILYKRFFYEILGITLLGILSSGLEFTTPVFIALIENYLASDEPLWRGIALVIYLLIIKLIKCIVTNHYNFFKNLLSMHIKSGLSSEIYQKLLRISLSSISQNKDDSLSYGKIINLIQVDLDCIVSGIVNSMNIIILPFILGVGLYMNFKTVGFAGGMTGTVIIVILMVCNLFFGKKLSVVQKILMEKRDKRMKVCNELFNNIRIYKIYNWEVKLSDYVMQARDEELEQQKITFMWNAMSLLLMWGAQNYIAAGILTAMTLSGVTLTPLNVFAGLSVIRVIKSTMDMLPSIVNSFIQTKVSLTRIQEYLRSKDQSFYIENYSSNSVISMKNASFSWDSKVKDSKKIGELIKTKRILKNLTFDIHQGELIAIVGKFASGKSSLLQALIQNMVYIKDEDSQVNIFGLIAFCNQEAWIQNKTIRDNILFGKDFNEKKYWDVIRICMLQADLDIFPGGDMTEIGEKGINLSGGQKARVSIARAVYSDADIYLFDDPLAALDQYVGKILFEECIYKHLNNKTRIIVTNNQEYLSYADRILVIKSGKIKQFGNFSSLISNPGYFKDDFIIELKQAEMSELIDNNTEKSNGIQGKGKKLIENEDRVIGSVKFSVYKNYFINAGGIFIVFLGVLAMIAWQTDRTFTDFYLASWTNQSSSEQNTKRLENIVIFVTGSFFISIFIYLRALNTFYASLRAARVMFVKMLTSLLNAPIPLFYDVNPMGRILNRLSKDQSIIDSEVAYAINWAMACIFSLFMIICFCIYNIPLVLLSLPIAAYTSYKIQQFYLGTSRELIRLESISKSPIIQHFSETLNGISTIRAFGYQKMFIENYFKLIDKNNSFMFYKSGCYCWLAMCIEIVSDFVLFISTMAIVYGRDYIDPGLSGICLIYILMLPDDIYYLINATTNLENYMVSVERVHNMEFIVSENNRSCFKDQWLKSSNWPSQGVIKFYKYSARYRPDTDIILNNVSFTINSHEKIGIMGKTGSGKSSIVNALFRVFECFSGRIFIDDVDIAEIGLDLLRQKLSVIPQDPALFQGTLRENIDLLKQFSDEKILNTLKLVQLDFGDKGLDMEIKENASNLSVGQKQLICIVRALLKKSKIVILDEATASIDFKTDMIIQKVIKEGFGDCTVLTIAHRINTIMNSDRILVLDKGQVVEFDTPQKLQEANGHFCKLANYH
ncbi:hypothetical protein SteCoe_30112 [Stentor coeruleus]|uniref:Uncharacterized protein n=1 Tax=Stentor coeruleus TaxID=5963 RepID=A0A1R2B4A4_9CILI|nr:hypothetical protein SteCoe_30112 [Stentor coeruleus]